MRDGGGRPPARRVLNTEWGGRTVPIEKLAWAEVLWRAGVFEELRGCPCGSDGNRRGTWEERGQAGCREQDRYLGGDISPKLEGDSWAMPGLWGTCKCFLSA